MTQTPKREFRVNCPSNIPGCASSDPTKVFKPMPPNDCLNCRKSADYTCYDTAKLLGLPIPKHPAKQP